jgi:hypothetical protein
MRFAYYSREIAGWTLILFGLACFWTAYVLLMNKLFFQAGPTVFMGFIIFRGGVHVLKVAVAAQAARTLPDTAPSTVRRAPKVTLPSVGPTPPKAVLPGPKKKSEGTVARGR